MSNRINMVMGTLWLRIGSISNAVMISVVFDKYNQSLNYNYLAIELNSLFSLFSLLYVCVVLHLLIVNYTYVYNTFYYLSTIISILYYTF